MGLEFHDRIPYFTCTHCGNTMPGRLLRKEDCPYHPEEGHRNAYGLPQGWRMRPPQDVHQPASEWYYACSPHCAEVQDGTEMTKFSLN